VFGKIEQPDEGAVAVIAGFKLHAMPFDFLAQALLYEKPEQLEGHRGVCPRCRNNPARPSS